MLKPRSAAKIQGKTFCQAAGLVGYGLDLFKAGQRLGGDSLQGPPHQAGNISEADGPGQEELHRFLIGADERDRGGAAFPAGRLGQPEGREVFVVRGLKSQVPLPLGAGKTRQVQG